MSTAKKPVATVKANFKKTAAPAKEAMGKAEETVKAVKEEKTVEKKVEKKAAPAAKEEAKKETVKKAPVKAAEKKAAPAAKAEAKEEKKSAPVAKAEEKKAPAKKAEPAKKTPAAKAVAEVVLQWNGNDYTYDRLLQSAKDVWQYDQGKNVADFKTAQIYVKPEEGKAYVVVNGTDELSFDI